MTNSTYLHKIKREAKQKDNTVNEFREEIKDTIVAILKEQEVKDSERVGEEVFDSLLEGNFLVGEKFQNLSEDFHFTMAKNKKDDLIITDQEKKVTITVPKKFTDGFVRMVLMTQSS